MSVTPKLTLIGLYNYTEGAIFDSLTVPEAVSKPAFISRLLLTRGEMSVLYPDPDFFTEAVGIWSTTWLPNFNRIAAALADDYNPLHNFDRYEVYTDNETRNQIGTTEATAGTESENKVSAYNESTYQPDNINNTGSTSSATSSVDEDRELSRDGHLYGNIGVTTSQQMLEAEISLRVSERLLDIMADRFAEELLILVY